MNTRTARTPALVLISLAIAALVSCMPVSEDSEQPAASMHDPEPMRQVFRSSKVVSTNCEVSFWTSGPPGFAEGEGKPVKDMPPPMVEMLAVGAGREMVPTDPGRVSPGLVLIETNTSVNTLLINNDHEVVATIENQHKPGHSEILPNGNRLVASARWNDTFVGAGGFSGCIEEFTADGELVWRLGLSTDKYITHHDIARMENGNILAIVWENETTEQAVSQGRDPEGVAENGQFWYDGVIEINPYTAEIVWEWSTRYHLIQDFDESKENFGVVSDNPGLLDINKFAPRPNGEIAADWSHLNSIDYNEELDQILLSSNFLSEIYIIDHSTTPFEATGHKGGRYGKGGDFLYRWGNPHNYNRGTEEDQKIYHQHDAQWIRDGLNGAGNILLFNNGGREVHRYSTVVEITPPMMADGTYLLPDDGPYGPEEMAWEYDPEPPERFFSFFISGVQRMPNGNTLVTQGAGAKVREVTPEGEIVWEYRVSDYGSTPDMLFRANRYPPDHPGIAKILSIGK